MIHPDVFFVIPVRRLYAAHLVYHLIHSLSVKFHFSLGAWGCQAVSPGAVVLAPKFGVSDTGSQAIRGCCVSPCLASPCLASPLGTILVKTFPPRLGEVQAIPNHPGEVQTRCSWSSLAGIGIGQELEGQIGTD